ncbi:drs2 neo1 protein [Rhizina undulata]
MAGNNDREPILKDGSEASSPEVHSRDNPTQPARTSSNRVRFSTDIERRSPPTTERERHTNAGRVAAAAGLTIDTGSWSSQNSGRGSLDIRAEVGSYDGRDDGRYPTAEPQTSPIPRRAPLSPTSTALARKRNRGYSLRRQLFFRNANDQLDEEARGPQRPPSAVGHSSANDAAIELGSIPTPSDGKGTEKRHIGKDGEETDHDHDSKRSSMPPIANVLPHYTLWARKQSNSAKNQITAYYHKARKFILRVNEIPPSKEGRKIPLEATGQENLIDERTGQKYIDNTIRSSRYTPWNFLPKQLFAQFSKLANFYFLCVSILQMIPTLSTTGTYTTIVPLIFFISISMFKEGYDDYRRYKLDKQENNRDAEVLHVYKPTDANGNSGPRHWAKTKWKDIRVGDIIKLQRDDWVPADVVLLHSTGQGGIAYVETMALDGETNLKSKQALPITAENCETIEKLAVFQGQVVVEDPNLDLYNFEGNVIVGKEIKPLTNNQVIYRGSVLRNTASLTGMVIFTGEETKIRMNANKNPRTKAPSLQALVNKIVILVVMFVVALAVFNTVAYQIWRTRTESRSWYLANSTVAFFPIFASYVIMFNTMIPLSLYVSMEIIKVAQMVLLNDIDMYDEETDTPLEARTSTINEDCGQVSFIFSDKTGTLTDNAMLFRKISVAGHAWLHDLDIRREANERAGRLILKHKKRKAKDKGKKTSSSVAKPTVETTPGRKSYGDVAFSRSSHGTPPKLSLDGRHYNKESSGPLRWKSSAIPTKAQPQLSTLDLLDYLQSHPHTFFARKARFFLLSIAICHTCLPEVSDDDKISYQSASPDELALVTAAQELGYIAFDRQINTISIKTFPNGPEGDPVVEVYEILQVIEFSSKRKRMSNVVRMPNGKICIFSKGADSAMIELLRLKDLAAQKVMEVERRASKRKSLEAQEVIRRNSMQRTSIGGRSSIGGPSRPSMSGRPSFSGRPSLSGRPSMNVNRLQPIMDEFDEWLRDKEADVDMSSLDDDSIYSRPSVQFASRHSIAFGETPNTPLERDTSDDVVDESLALDDSKVLERCFAHVNDFASEGLRTLLYAHRFMEDEEYAAWRKIYNDATTSLVDRQSNIERAAELVERDFELSGATAIEDKLQKGVPEAIDKLRRAGIKLWMLTGDKRETAINIGHSCRLIKDYSTITILDKEDGDISQKMAAAILEINGGTIAHSVVVVDGGTLARIEEDETLSSLFFDIAILTDSVVCCRASPSQKASLVKTIRTKVNKSVTLAIGDGANDIAMIQEAHVGIGITGKEGLQAARVSDYSMAQFRFLLKFLLVHGRWNYNRICKYTVGTFWKELLFYLTQALFQRWNGYTGTSFYESWSLSMFNTLFTSLPVIFMGIFEKDLAAATLLAVPELYRRGQQNAGFNFRIYLGWMFLASAQAMIAYFMTYGLYAPRLMVDNGIFAMGALTFSVCITVISVKMQVVEMHNKSILVVVSVVASVGGWFLWNIILAETYNSRSPIYNVKDGILRRFGVDLNWWLVYIFSVSTCIILDIAFIAFRVAFWPTDVDAFQEIEQCRELRKRLEEAASGELQQGWDRGTKKASAEMQREGEVQELLDRPRIMEEGKARRSLGRARASLSVPAGELGEVEEEEDIDEIVARRFGSIRR